MVFHAVFLRNGVPSGIRTRVIAVKGQRPRPLDDGDEVFFYSKEWSLESRGNLKNV
jgi:hypothetical protein